MSYFEFTDEVHPIYPECRRIVATQEGKKYYKGTVGGFAESESNLVDGAFVYSEAVVRQGATIYGENPIVSGNAIIEGRAAIREGSVVGGTSRVTGSAEVRGQARVYGASVITDDALIEGHTALRDTKVSGWTDLRVSGPTISGGLIEHQRHFMTLDPIGSEDVQVQLYRTADPVGNRLRVGCWVGTVQELPGEVEKRAAYWICTPQQEKAWKAQYKGLEMLALATMEGW